MRKRVKRELYALGARLTVFLHFFMLLFYFAAIPLLFTKTVWSLIAAAYLVFEWFQYLVFDSCVLNILENHFLRKAGRENHNHTILMFMHNIVRGQSSKAISKPSVDRLSWYFKTAWFVVAVIIIILSSPIKAFL
jgi:hypothetical protein